MLLAFLLRLPGLRAVAGRCGALLCGARFSALSHALRGEAPLAMARFLVLRLCARFVASPRPGERIAIDSMALCVPRSQRHGLKKMNDKTAGGGVLWSLRLCAPRGEHPVAVLGVMAGAWHDSRLLAACDLIADGPVYLMDRGFYAFRVLNDLLARRVRFVMRARARSLCYDVRWRYSSPRRIGSLQLTLDALVRLGSKSSRAARPLARLCRFTKPDGEELILVTNLWDAGAAELQAYYKERHQIERFHRLLKTTLGLAHLYSFQLRGLELLLWIALLLALLLFLEKPGDGEPALTVDAMQQALRELRRRLGMTTAWRRNIATKQRAKKSRKRIEANL